MTPRGPFDLLFQNRYFNGWPTLPGDPETIVMSFPVEGWAGSAAVTLRQRGDEVDVRVVGPAEIAEKAEAQALAAIALDVDGTEWPRIGERNALLGELQRQYHFMRPSMFHSPYEAAASFLIGHRISVVQTRRIRARLAETNGVGIEVDGSTFFAIPDPQTLLGIASIPGVADVKIERLHAAAHAALDGLLDRDHLRSLSEADALAELRTISGVGPFFAQAILYRGAGVPTGLTTDPVSLRGLQRAFDLAAPPTPAEAERLTADWQPLRTWAISLLHTHLRETDDMPQRGGPAR
jgi:DNA-3-methyladenine glycosylase II